MSIQYITTAVKILSGLYYGVKSVEIFKKLVSDQEYYDYVYPDSAGRPTVDSQEGYGLLGFAAGLYPGVTKMPDSGLFTTKKGAYTFKMPWEVHLRRKQVPPMVRGINGAFNGKENSVGDNVKVDRAKTETGNKSPSTGAPSGDTITAAPRRNVSLPAQSRIAKDRAIIQGKRAPGNVPALKSERPVVPPGRVKFELKGEWWDLNWSNTKFLNFTFEFEGTEEFEEVTLGHMSNSNFQEGAVRGVSVELTENNGSTTKTTPVTTDEQPVFFHKVGNPRMGVLQDTEFTYRDVHIVPVAPTSMKELRAWFDFEDPESVKLKLDGSPSPEYQEINYEW